MFSRFSNKVGVIALLFSFLYFLIIIIMNSKIPEWLWQLITIPPIFSIAISGIWLKELITNSGCLVCKKQAYDILFAEKKLGNFCRVHLLQKYAEEFQNNKFNLVMIEYQAKSDVPHSTYLYDPVDDIDWGDQKIIVEDLIQTIPIKKCRVCESVASVLFVSKEVAKFVQAADPEFAVKGEYLCKKHALETNIPNLQNTKSSLALFLPFKANGLQATYF